MDRRAALAVGRAWHGLPSAQGALPAGAVSLDCRLEEAGWRKQALQALLWGQG